MQNVQNVQNAENEKSGNLAIWQSGKVAIWRNVINSVLAEVAEVTEIAEEDYPGGTPGHPYGKCHYAKQGK